MKSRVAIIVLLLLLLSSGIALASDITSAGYVGQIQVTNTDAAATDESSVFDLNTSALIQSDMINDTATDAAVRTAAGDDVAFMPGWGENPWVHFVPSIGQNEQRYFYLYTGGVTGGTVRYFPDTDGMTITDDASLEPADNFEFEINTFVDTTLGVEATAGDNYASDGTSHTVTLPDDIEAGDLLLAFFGADGVPVITFPAGWTQIYQVATGSIIKSGAWYRVADGSETATISVTTSNAEMTAHTVYLISKDSYTGTPESATATGSSANPNPPNLDPSWGAEETLWFSSSLNDTGTTSVTAYPANYTDGRNDRANNVGGCGLGTARYSTIATDENPGAFTLEIYEPWIAATVAVHQQTRLIIKSGAVGLWVSDVGDVAAMMLDAAPVRLSVSGVSAAEHEITVYADTTNLGISIDGGAPAVVALGGATTPDNANNWVIGGEATPYIEDYQHSVSGSLMCLLEWEYGAAFHDQSDNGVHENDATPSFRSSSSNSDISAELVSLSPAYEAASPPAPDSPYWEMMDVPEEPGKLYEELNMTFFGAGVIQDFSDATGMPLAIPVFIYALGAALVLGLGAYRLSMGRHGRGSLLIQAIVSLVVMVYFVAAGDGVIPMLVLIPFGLEALALIIWRQTPGPW